MLVLLVTFLLTSRVWAAGFVSIIDSVEVKGLKSMPKEKLLSLLGLKKGDMLTYLTVQDVKKKLVQSGLFSYVEVSVKKVSKIKSKLIIEVRENPRIAKVVIKDKLGKLPDDLRKKIKGFEGKVLNVAELKRVFNSIASWYKEKKGVLVNVEMKPLEKDVIAVLIDPIIIDSIEFEGLKKTKKTVLLREMKLRPGSVCDLKQLRKDLWRIYDLGYFSEVEPQILPTYGNKVKLKIRVKEEKTGVTIFGVGYSSATGVSGYVKVEDTNFRGLGKRVYVQAEFGGYKSYEFSYTDNWFMGKKRTLDFSLYNTKVKKDYYTDANEKLEYDEKRRGYSIYFGKPIFKGAWNFGWRFTDEKVELEDADELIAQLGDKATNNEEVQRLSLDFLRRTVNSVLLPSKGYSLGFTVTFTGDFLKGDNGFRKFFWDFKYYRDVYKSKVILAQRLRYGFISLVEGEIPVYEKFYVGGANTLRGYKEYSYNGKRTLVYNSELRWRFAKNFEFVLFYDLADAWDTDSDIKAGRGFGLRVKTPIGMVRFEVGRAQGETRTYFNLGNAF